MPGLLYLWLDSNSGTVTLPEGIETDKMVLKTYRIQHTLTNDAKASNVMYFNADWINTGAIQTGSNSDSTQAMVGLPLLVDNVQIFVRNCNLSFLVSKPITRQFNYTLHGLTDTGFMNCTLVFEF